MVGWDTGQSVYEGGGQKGWKDQSQAGDETPSLHTGETQKCSAFKAKVDGYYNTQLQREINTLTQITHST